MTAAMQHFSNEVGPAFMRMLHAGRQCALAEIASAICEDLQEGEETKEDSHRCIVADDFGFFPDAKTNEGLFVTFGNCLTS